MQEQLIPSVFFLNAGIAGNQAPEISGFELEKHRKLMDVNYFGVLAFVEIWKNVGIEKDGAHFIVTSSVNAIWAPPKGSAYATSKIAISKTFEALSQTFHETNLKFTSIHPGPVATKVSRVPFIWSTKKMAHYMINAIGTKKQRLYPSKFYYLLCHFFTILPHSVLRIIIKLFLN